MTKRTTRIFDAIVGIVRSTFMTVLTLVFFVCTSNGEIVEMERQTDFQNVSVALTDLQTEDTDMPLGIDVQ